MELSQLVTSLETSQRLKELGVKQESLFYWGRKVFSSYGQGDSYSDEYVNYGDRSNDSYCSFITTCSAFTSSELGEMLPLFEVRKKGPDYYRSYSKLVVNENDYFMSDEENMAESMGKLYIHLKENNLI